MASSVSLARLGARGRGTVLGHPSCGPPSWQRDRKNRLVAAFFRSVNWLSRLWGQAGEYIAQRADSEHKARPSTDPRFQKDLAMSDTREGLALQRITHAVAGLLSPRFKNRQLEPGDDLRKSGLSSLDLVKLVLKLEQEFQLMIPEQSITPQNFASIASIDTLIAGLIAKG
jgi:acyl carrier protein